MAKEIEHKYLVNGDSYRTLAVSSRHIVQGYIYPDRRAVVRVRIMDSEARLTIKGENRGSERDEWEYPIPADDAREMLDKLAVGNVIDKTRYFVDYGGFTWEIDEFHSPCPGLVVAEVELPSADTRPPLPPFAGEEVTGRPEYYNSVLSGLSRN